MSRRITSLLAATTLVAGLAVSVPTARAIPSHNGAVDTAKTTATAPQSATDAQHLITLLNQVEKQIKQAQKSGKVSPHDLGLGTLISGVEASVLGLLNTVTTAAGLPALPGLPGTSNLPPATQLEQQVKDAVGKMKPADLGGLGGLLATVEGLVLGLLNTVTGLLGLPPLPSLPPLPGPPALPVP